MFPPARRRLAATRRAAFTVVLTAGAVACLGDAGRDRLPLHVGTSEAPVADAPRASSTPFASADPEGALVPVASASPGSSAPAAAAPSGSASSAAPRFACAPPDHGFGRYHPYVALPRGRVLVPIVEAPPPDSAYDVLLHFHFHDAVRRVFVEVAHPMVLAGLDLGEGSKAYGDAFSDPQAFVAMRASIEAALRETSGDQKAHIGKLYLSSWSAGFGASTRILKQHPGEVSGMIFLDSLYAPSEKDEQGEPRPRSVFAPAVAPVLALARRTLKGEGFLFLSYSRTPTHGYASTEDVARHLEQRLGLREAHEPPSEEPRALLARIDREGLHVRAFGGNDAKAHCHHLGVVRDALALLTAR